MQYRRHDPSLNFFVVEDSPILNAKLGTKIQDHLVFVPHLDRFCIRAKTSTALKLYGEVRVGAYSFPAKAENFIPNRHNVLVIGTQLIGFHETLLVEKYPELV